MPLSADPAAVGLVIDIAQTAKSQLCAVGGTDLYTKLDTSDSGISGQISCCVSNHQLIRDIAAGLLHPSVPLSQAAAWKLQHGTDVATQTYPLLQGSNAEDVNGCISPVSTSHHRCTEHTLEDDSGQLPQEAAAVMEDGHQPDQGAITTSSCRTTVLLRSLPTELLYDNTGLQLFDQITYLPEYYLTSAEADILETHGPDIVREAIRHGTTIIELGVGSMRKTKILLDAVVKEGVQGVQFIALDLCREPLQEALHQLQGHFQGNVKLAGLVGTYQQGLAYIQQQQQQQQQQQGVSSSTSKVNPVPIAAAILHSKALAPSGPEDYCEEGPKHCCNVRPSTCDDVQHNGTSQTHESCGQTANRQASNHSGGTAAITASASCGAANGSAAAKQSKLSGSSKLIMWLGSSIGNYDREEAARFVTQIKELAMQPGDFLLVGIDRRNAPETVAAAYNDAAGVTNSFIMNGLKHCQEVLDMQLQHMHQQRLSSESKPCESTAKNSGSGRPLLDAQSSRSPLDSCNSIDLDAFKYFCLYNDKMGRHEAYYQATQDTKIILPSVGSAIEAADSKVADQAQACDIAATTCAVEIAAGELIHIEFSYKYAAHEVLGLAAAAGLYWAKAWTDSKQQFDLHLFKKAL